MSRDKLLILIIPILVGAQFWYDRPNPDFYGSSEYQKIADSLNEEVKEKGPTEAFATLTKLMGENKDVLRDCHGLVHEIGHASYEKLQDFPVAIKYEDKLCGSGYLHGVIESYFSNTPDVMEKIKTVCDVYSDKTDHGRCMHGIGHGIMFYNQNDLPAAVQTCASFEDSESQIRCSEGVYMENFGTNEDMHQSEYLKPEDPFYPCAEQDEKFKGVCYFYSPIYYLNLHNDDYETALKWCLSAEADQVMACTKGLGSRAMKYNLADAKLVESICESGTADQKPTCIDGMISYYLVNFESLSKGRKLCSELKPENAEICLSSLESRSSLFGE